MFHWRKWVAFTLLLTWLQDPLAAFAATSEEIRALQAEMQNKQAEVAALQKRLEEYRAKISGYESQAKSLATDIALLENEQGMVEVDIATTEAEIQSQELEIALLSERMKQTDGDLTTQQALLKDALFALHAQDIQGGTFEVILASENIDDVFRKATDIASVNTQLQKTLATTQKTRQSLEAQRRDEQTMLEHLTTLKEDLDKKHLALEGAKQAKEIVMSQTQDSEEEYRNLLQKIRAEQQDVSSRITELQDTITQRLADEDAKRGTSGQGSTTITWPLTGVITTTFHDPTYPFRHLFEHSGLDIAVPQGTAIEAAAPGIVAWARTGNMYGNYVMIIHANGMATLYAHMSRMDVQQDQYVTRGQVIGLSGGRAGSPGAGFSTGPHLHFEVRENGIPVDPYRFLP